MALEEYKKKRNFQKTSEPEGKKKSKQNELIFVVQKHAATNLHYDFRLELDGVLKSWAVPKGPSINPDDKRLAMMVEDHPIDYAGFEGIIPEGNYGAGEVIVWDKGTYHSLQSEDYRESINFLHEGLQKGDLKFYLHGEKLKGAFVLVKIKNQKNSWLLIKKKDEFADKEDITRKDKSVLSQKTLEEIAEKNKKKVSEISEKVPHEKLKNLPGKKFPSNILPMLATLVDEPFDDPEWLYEIKWDGYRAIAEVKNGEVNLHSRTNKSFNIKFSPIAETLKNFDADIILDGEVVVLDEDGRASFQLLQNYQRTGKGNLIYYVFDLIYLDKYDLRNLPLIDRKEILQKILPENKNIFYSDHIFNNGIDFFNLVQQKNIEGILAKNSNSKYISRRSKEWLKIKVKQRTEAIICGYTKPKGSRKNFGALVLGAYKNGELIYIGHTGGGFNDDDLKEIYNILQPYKRKTSPFKKVPKTNTPVTWVEPELICEVLYSEWTEDLNLRHPVFWELREDKKPQEVILEESENTKEFLDKNGKKNKKDKKDNNASGKNEKILSKSPLEKEIYINNRKLKLTNLDKIYFPDDGYTKENIIEYYRKISRYILPYLKDRPESLHRHPNGIKQKGFYQKDVAELPPDWVTTKKIYSESNDKEINYLVCNNEETLIYIANLGCIEINPWFSRVDKLDKPDYLVIDLDPEDISFDKVIDAAIEVKKILDIAGANSYCKTSGATGLHIYVPLNAKYDYDIAKDFAHLVCKIVHNIIPGFTSIERNPSKRKKKVYLDYLQNRTGQTLAAPYSIRPRPGAPVATPLKWSEVKKGLNPSDFNIENIHNRLKKKGDIFIKILKEGIDINKSISNLEKRL